MMRKLLTVAVIVSLSLFTLVGCNKDEDDNTNVKRDIVVDEDSIQAEMVQNTETTETAETTEPQGDGGGNEYVNEGETLEVKTISILVSEDDYFYENAPIEFDEIVGMLEYTGGEVVVEITDNKATHKAYNKLVEKLEELEISVIEQ